MWHQHYSLQQPSSKGASAKEATWCVWTRAELSNLGGNLQAGVGQDPKYSLLTTGTDFNQLYKGYHTVRTFRPGDAHFHR